MGTMVDLPDAELEVLACLQQHGKATAREIREKMYRYRPMAHASTGTLLGRLEAKGLVRKKKGNFGKAFVYTPTAISKRTASHVVKRLLQRVFHGDGVALVASLFESRKPTPEELARLRRLLRELRVRRAPIKPSAASHR
ncbi:MAG: BlaI/MecI/CopY family transcriptional regulator [Verrucomicrobiia bacterium]